MCLKETIVLLFMWGICLTMEAFIKATLNAKRVFMHWKRREWHFINVPLLNTCLILMGKSHNWEEDVFFWWIKSIGQKRFLPQKWFVWQSQIRRQTFSVSVCLEPATRIWWFRGCSLHSEKKPTKKYQFSAIPNNLLISPSISAEFQSWIVLRKVYSTRIIFPLKCWISKY